MENKKGKKFDKKEYNKDYNTELRVRLNINISITEKQFIDCYLLSRNLSVSSYLKELINADFIAHGLQPIFYDKRKKQDN